MPKTQDNVVPKLDAAVVDAGKPDTRTLSEYEAMVAILSSGLLGG
jgi:hypothetical protein